MQDPVPLYPQGLTSPNVLTWTELRGHDSGIQTCTVLQVPHAYLIAALGGNIPAFNVCAHCAVAVGTVTLMFHD